MRLRSGQTIDGMTGGMATGVLARGAIISAVYKRALRLTQKARGELPNGKLVNHISTDTSRIDFAAGFFNIIWSAPIQVRLSPL